MIPLVEFLNARLDEDEAAARAATPGPWWQGDEDSPHVGDYGWYVAGCPAGETEDTPQGRIDAAWIARNDPARALREVAAKREIIAALDELEIETMDPDDSESIALALGLVSALTALASVYSSHVDFRDEWRM